jgi:hypothetical protein
MTALNPKKQKAGWAKIDGIFADTANVWVIHYSCESFYDRPNGASPSRRRNRRSCVSNWGTWPSAIDPPRGPL